MEGRAPNQQATSFEEEMRLMILNQQNPDENTPRVRLPPANYGPNFAHPQHLPRGHNNGNIPYGAPATSHYPRQTPPVSQTRQYQPPQTSQAPPSVPHHPPAHFSGFAHTAGGSFSMYPPAANHQQQPHFPQRGQRGYSRGAGRGGPAQRQQRQQQIQLDPNAFARGGPVQGQGRPHLFDPNFQHRNTYVNHSDQRERQLQYLQQIVQNEVPPVEMTQAERDEKEAFRATLQKLCHEVCDENPKLPKVQLECFGSFASGFASAGSDMDLALVVQGEASTDAVFSMLEDDLPRALEKKLLQSGHGARLLTRTRVPIIKVCESPGLSFLDKLRAEREKWDELPNEKKYPHLYPEGGDEAEDDDHTLEGTKVEKTLEKLSISANDSPTSAAIETKEFQKESVSTEQPTDTPVTASTTSTETTVTSKADGTGQVKQKREYNNTWTRERKPGPLDFPKDGVGIQCDINFFNPLGLHNTQMLRCYSLCDPRVRPMVLFVKSWAKRRKINSSYSGTLSSYGYVLMVLHYLMNVAQPPVLPNLQLPWRPSQQCTPQGASKVEVDGWDVDFWRNENEIMSAVQSGQMSSNQESLGSLLAGFFQYYSSQGSGPQFRWTTSVLSLRSQGGVLTKESKGWVKATTEENAGKRVQYRYLFCIEDPFELTHNVARTVTHNGIVAIRDEFRRAHRILVSIGYGRPSHEGELYEQLVEPEQPVETPDGLKPLEATADLEKCTPDQTAPPLAPQARQDRPPQPRPAGRGRGAARMQHQQRQDPRTLNLGDQEAFPTLGSAAGPKKRQQKGKEKDVSSIDGEKAQAYLEDYRRKKAEAEAEQTANQSAEWVLHD